MKALLLLLGLFSTGFISCRTPRLDDPNPGLSQKTPVKEAYQYLALGDSYTIGQSVAVSASFPAQLVKALKSQQIAVADPEIIAQTGWTTNELQVAIDTKKPIAKYDIVTLLIGVNNQFRGYNEDAYRQEFVALLNQAIHFAKDNRQHVFVLSIPDYSVTPYAKDQDKNSIAKQIDQFNAINKEETLKAKVPYVDITAISRMAAYDATLVAGDGLHPSANMYLFWVRELLPLVLTAVK